MLNIFFRNYILTSLCLIVFSLSYRPVILEFGIIISERPYSELGKKALVLLSLINLLIMLLLSMRKIRGDILVSKKGLFLFISVFLMIVYFYITSFWNPYKLFQNATNGFFLFNMFQFLYITSAISIMRSIDKKGFVNQFVNMLIILSLIASVSALPDIFHADLSWRLIGIMGDSPTFGALCAIGLVCSFHKFVTIPSLRFFMAILMVWFYFFVLFSGSRNAQLTLIISLVFYAYLYWPHWFSTPRFFLYMISILFFIVITINSDVQPEFFLKDISAPDEHSRLFIWSTVADMYVNSEMFNKIFGHGFGFLKQNFRSAHNSYLQILVEYGLLFLFFFLLTITNLLRHFFYKKNVAPRYILLATITIFFISFSFNLYVIFPGVFNVLNITFFSLVAIALIDTNDQPNLKPYNS